VITIEDFDVDLLVAYRGGDRAAFNAVYARHAPAIMRYAWSKLDDRGSAEEALQETFLTAWNKRRSGVIVDESLLPWLLVICRNHVRNMLRRDRKHHRIGLEANAALDGNRDAAGRSELAWIAEEMQRLSPIDRAICQLCLVDGLSYAEAARMLETTEAAVGKRLQRAKARLRQAGLEQ
jgi:RNA polymerase sigma factor (sigma-70 family)